MKYTFVIGFHNSSNEERIESNYLPRYVTNNTGEIYLSIIGKEVEYLYWPLESYIKCIYEEC